MSTQGWGLGLDSAKRVSPQSLPAPDVHDIGRHMFMGTEIDNNNGVNCYRTTAVFLPPDLETVCPVNVYKWMNRVNSEIKCDTVILLSIELF